MAKFMARAIALDDRTENHMNARAQQRADDVRMREAKTICRI